jgi:chemotaxis methyl-accepting protein methylase
MPTALQMSRLAYSLLLALYPEELRFRFGAEMTEVFADEISAQWRQRGIPGVLRVWLTAGSEVFSIAVPLQMSNPATIATALAFLISSFLFYSFFRAVS